MMAEVVGSGAIRGMSGSTTGSGTGAGAGFGAAFFFLGFLDIIAPPPAPPRRQQQHKAARRSHCQVLKYEPQEPDPVDPELALEPDESPEEPHLKELLYEDFKESESLDDADESHGVKVVVVTVVCAAAQAKRAAKHTSLFILATEKPLR
jgi:hypothetical protein